MLQPSGLAKSQQLKVYKAILNNFSTSSIMSLHFFATNWRTKLSVVYYESLKRELKTKTTYGYRCNERLKTNVKESTRLACTMRFLGTVPETDVLVVTHKRNKNQRFGIYTPRMHSIVRCPVWAPPKPWSGAVH